MPTGLMQIKTGPKTGKIDTCSSVYAEDLCVDFDHIKDEQGYIPCASVTPLEVFD